MSESDPATNSTVDTGADTEDKEELLEAMLKVKIPAQVKENSKDSSVKEAVGSSSDGNDAGRSAKIDGGEDTATKDVEAGSKTTEEADDDEWPTEEMRYDLSEYPIGKGAFAKVYIARCQKDSKRGEDLAIKVMNLERGTLNLDHLRQEVTTMKLCKHPNVLPLYSCFVVKSNLWLVMPFMNMGSCLEIMRQLKGKGGNPELNEEWISAILRGAVEGLAYLHKSGWIHRDIKSGNILLDNEANVMLADFGVTGIMDPDVTREDKIRKTFVGTPCWMAPEVMKQSTGYTEKADIWSLGITTLELAKSIAPYAKEKTMRVLLRTLQEDPPSIETYEKYGCGGKKSKDFTSGFHKFYKRLLVKDPSKRPTAEEILKDRFLSRCKDPKGVLMKELIAKLDVLEAKKDDDDSGRVASSGHVVQVSIDPSGATGDSMTLDQDLLNSWRDPDKEEGDQQFTLAKTNSTASTGKATTTNFKDKFMNDASDDE